MQAEQLFESVPNFSEGRRREVIDSIAGAVSAHAFLLDVDSDADHNRSVVSLAGFKTKVFAALLAAVAEAKQRIDLRTHQGVHPRVGAADVVPLVPLGETAVSDAQVAARELGERIWAELEIPVFFYGSGTGRTLADIRAGRVQPDVGGPSLHPTAGAVCVGARPALVAFNVVLHGIDLVAARALARSIRESQAGLRGVQALAFPLSNERLQLSMNLFRLDETRPADVIAELERRGVSMEAQEIVALCPAIAASAAADGRVLEGRMASAAARAASALCRERASEEHFALAVRLDVEADELARLPADQDAFLGGAERAAALVRVVRAAGISDPELDAMALAAAGGLRAAISAGTAGIYQARVDALDARLGERTR